MHPLKKEFTKFLMVVEQFELYNKTGSNFSLGGHKIKKKGKTITPAQACFILTFFWYDEVLKSNSHTKEVSTDIWNVWQSQLNLKAPLNPGNWDTFKKKHS